MKDYIIKAKYGLLLLFSILFLIGCKENELIQYENDAALYFLNETYKQKDSIKHSFFVLSPNAVRDTVYVKVNTMGYLTNEDRPIAIEQTNKGKENAAVAGVHYVPFDNPEVKKYMIVPAGQASANFPIIFLRDKSLDLTEVRLEMRIVKNDYFRPGIDAFREFLVTTTAQAVKPDNWDTSWRNYFGQSWGSVKMRFIIDITGYTEWNVLPSDFSYLNYMVALVQQKLLEYNLANPDAPLREADGNLVNFDK